MTALAIATIILGDMLLLYIAVRWWPPDQSKARLQRCWYNARLLTLMVRTAISITVTFLFVVPVAICFWLLFNPSARAHDAPSGWPYPKDCCSQDGRECSRVSCLAISEDRNGWHYNGMVFTKQMLRPSGDTDCHVCYGNSGIPHCILLPNRPQS
jgi:hypothetical protein